MNVILNGSQSNTRRGDITLLGSVDLTGKENQALKIVNSGGVAKFALPTAITDMVPFICMSGDAAGSETAGEAPARNENCRVLVSGAVAPGDKLSLDPNNLGKFYVAGAGAGATNYWYVAEETAAANGLCLVRPIGPVPVTL